MAAANDVIGGSITQRIERDEEEATDAVTTRNSFLENIFFFTFYKINGKVTFEKKMSRARNAPMSTSHKPQPRNSKKKSSFLKM